MVRGERLRRLRAEIRATRGLQRREEHVLIEHVHESVPEGQRAIRVFDFGFAAHEHVHTLERLQSLLDIRRVEAKCLRENRRVELLALDGRAQRSPLVRLDLLFLIDSTGSMGGEIAKIQSTLVSISDRIARLGGQPAIRYAGVTYRDRGDQYVVRKFGFTDDLQRFQGWLNGIRAGGGGDYPESLNEALHVAVNDLDWDQGEAVRLISWWMAEATTSRGASSASS